MLREVWEVWDVWRKGTRARQEQTGVAGAGRGLRKAEKASDQRDENMRRPSTDDHAARCSLLSSCYCPIEGWETTVRRMIIKSDLCHDGEGKE